MTVNFLLYAFTDLEMSTPVTPDFYRLRPTEIDHTKCAGRKLRADTEDKRWAPCVKPEFQCSGPVVFGSDLCASCISHQHNHRVTGNTTGTWNGRVTEEPPAWCHMLGTAWAAKCKWRPDRPDQFGAKWSLFTDRLASRRDAESRSNAAPDPAPVTTKPDRNHPNIGETVYCSFGRGQAKHEYSATFTLHPKNGTHTYTVDSTHQPTPWSINTEFDSPSGFAVACEMSHKGTTTKGNQNGWNVCYVKRDGVMTKLNDLPAPPQLIVTERDEIDVLRAQNASLEARIAALEAQVAALGASNATKDAKLTAIRAAFDV
jgi:hypothetical protein